MQDRQRDDQRQEWERRRQEEQRQEQTDAGSRAASTPPTPLTPQAQPGPTPTQRPEARQEAPRLAPQRAERPEPAAAVRPAYNAVQAVQLLIGVAFVAVGAIALSRGGFDELNLHNEVLNIPHTPLLGLMELIVGTAMVLGVAAPDGGRRAWMVIGGLLVAWGLLLVIIPGTFNAALGTEAANGWIYLIAGVLTLAAAFLLPMIAKRGAGPER